MVHGHAPGRADLVLAAVALADRPALVVLGRQAAAQLLVDLARQLGHALLVQERHHRHLHGREPRVQAQQRALAALDLLLVVGVHHERQRRAVGAGRGLDHVGHVALAGGGVHVVELLAGSVLVLGQVEVAAVGDALELRPAHREEVLDVRGRARVVRQLVGAVLAQPQLVLADAELLVPAHALVHPVHVPLRGVGGRGEELDLHLLELARAEDEVAGRDLVAERLADLGDPEGRLLAGELQDVLEVHEDALGGLRAQVDHRALVLDRAHVGLEHEVEVARLGQVAAALRALQLALGLLLAQVVLAPAPLALAEALHERVGEAREVAGRLPGARVHQDGRVEGHHVVALLHVRAPPLALHVRLQQHSVVAVVVGRGQAAVDLGALEDESAPLAKSDDFLHGDCVGRRDRGQSSGSVPRLVSPLRPIRHLTAWLVWHSLRVSLLDDLDAPAPPS